MTRSNEMMRAGGMSLRMVACLLSVAVLSGCTQWQNRMNWNNANGSRLIETNHQAVEKLLGSDPLQIGLNKSLIVTTVVDVDALEQSSTLGRLITEQIASRAAQMGYPVIELKVRKDFFIKDSEGELLLSRDARQLAISHDAQAAIVGTYAVVQDNVYVTLKLISLHNHRVLNGVDYSMPRSAVLASGGGTKVFDDPFYDMR
ncbi:MAG: FlgO family outer membrane protein [Methylophilaceae bacterium]|jgi:TolB-like protein|nr:FlgO family outer membrane protein [Methylophilaceae bacterium]